MNTITFLVKDSVYQKMKKHPEINWDEFLREKIVTRIKLLESFEKEHNTEGLLTMLASMDVLKKDWDNPEDERWNYV